MLGRGTPATRRLLLLAGLLAAIAAPLEAAADAAAARGATRPAPARLKAFRSCSDLVEYARRHGARLGAVGGVVPPPSAPIGAGPDEADGSRPAPVTAPSAPGRGLEGPESSTNVQELGVDEPDIVKADGGRVFVVAGHRLHAVDASASPARLLGSLPLGERSGHELLVHDGRALVLSQSPGGGPVGAAGTVVSPAPRAATVLTEVDVRDPAAMRVVSTLKVAGSYVSARRNGATARVVISTPPRALELAPAVAAPTEEARAGVDRRRRAAIRRSRLAGWMPSSVLSNRRTGAKARRALVPCRRVHRAAAFSGLGMVTVLTIDLARGLPAVDSDALMSDARTVYASTSSLYLATERWLAPDRSPEPPAGALTTAVHKLDISQPGRTEYRASGEVPGLLLSQWALSEHRGVLRAASTDRPLEWPVDDDRQAESSVTALEERAGRLVAVGRVGGLGRGERIFAVRFIDEVGFVVTFRQTDPLYTIDVSDPSSPRVLGELKVPGYSAYLHPLGDDLLLGVGQDATADGDLRGTQLSLFDISDLRRPVRLHQRAIGSASSSEVESDHRAFLWWPPGSLAVIPVQVHGDRPGEQPFAGAIGFTVDRARGIEEVGRVRHDAAPGGAPVRRALVLGERLVTVSEHGVMTSARDTLAGEGWLAFRSSGAPRP